MRITIITSDVNDRPVLIDFYISTSILANNANGQTRKAINDIAKAIIDDADSDS